MKKERLGLKILCTLLVMGLYSLIVLLVISKRTGVYWMSYAFTMLALAMPVLLDVLYRKKQNRFLNAALLPLTIVYVLGQVVFGLLFMLVPISWKPALIIQMLILGVLLILVLIFQNGKQYVTNLETERTTQMNSIKEVIRKAEYLYTVETDSRRKEALKKVYEACKYTDPMSNCQAIEVLDKEINDTLDELREKCSKKRTETDAEVESLIQKVLSLVMERSLKCRGSK